MPQWRPRWQSRRVRPAARLAPVPPTLATTAAPVYPTQRVCQIEGVIDTVLQIMFIVNSRRFSASEIGSSDAHAMEPVKLNAPT